MGAYLSEPKTTKDSSDSESSFVKCGSSSMQGWRVSQEVSLEDYHCPLKIILILPFLSLAFQTNPNIPNNSQYSLNFP